MKSLTYTPEDLKDTHPEFRKMVIDLFNEKIKLCQDVGYSMTMSHQEMRSFAGYLNRIIQDISHRASNIVEMAK